jgi:hypothetical protein
MQKKIASETTVAQLDDVMRYIKKAWTQGLAANLENFIGIHKPKS